MPPKKSGAVTPTAETEPVKKTWGDGGLFGNRALGSLFLMLVCPGFVITTWYTYFKLEGSIYRLVNEILDQKLMFFYNIWPTPFGSIYFYTYF